MTKKSVFFLTCLFVTWFASVAFAASPDPSAEVQREVRRALVTLPYYSVFDNLEFRVEGRKVVLAGQVVRPTLKTDAENAVKRLNEVESVENKIEVLPLSPADDQIRMAVYRAIYYHPNFTKYEIQAVPPIHIIVRNGHVTLVGVVSSKSDSDFAGIRAREVPGVFSVENKLTEERI